MLIDDQAEQAALILQNEKDKKMFITVSIDKETGEIKPLFYFDFPVLSTIYIKFKSDKNVLIYYIVNRFRPCHFSVEILHIETAIITLNIAGHSVDTNKDFIKFSTRVMNIAEVATILNKGNKHLSNYKEYELFYRKYLNKILQKPDSEEINKRFKQQKLKFY